MGNQQEVIIVGGGAAGMMAAISAARLGAQVTILERNNRIGKKILATGNGRCNFTNINADVDYYYGYNPRFAHSALATFPVEQTMGFFEKLGIVPKIEELGKVFPMSDQASSILDVLYYELQALNVRIITNAQVVEIKKTNYNRFKIDLANGQQYQSPRIILATGGRAMPSSGSDGSGYRLAESLGHKTQQTFPALVQLMLEGAHFKRISGVKFVGTAEILHRGKSLIQDQGDILFANYGVSGPPILQISRIAGDLLQQGEKVYLKIAIIDQMTKAELQKMIGRRCQVNAQKPVDLGFVGFINKRLIPVVLMESGIADLRKSMGDLSAVEQERIADVLTDWRFKVRGTRGWQSAQVTAGGLNTDQINPMTMESKLAPGLFFAGEIMDIDGCCGGFNLQWAWSSGYIAGQNAII